MEHYGNIIQTVSIFSIVICAPIGAVLISTFGPLFLSKASQTKTPEEIENQDEDKEIEMKDMEIEVETSKKKDILHGPPGEYSRKLSETIGGVDIADEDNQDAINTYNSPMKLKVEF
jgi:hypothetical protein